MILLRCDGAHDMIEEELSEENRKHKWEMRIAAKLSRVEKTVHIMMVVIRQ